MQSKFKRHRRAIERTDKNIIINKLFFYDKTTQMIDATNKFMSRVLTTGNINLQNFENELKPVGGKQFFIDGEKKIIKFTYKEELDLKYLFKLISRALLHKNEIETSELKDFDQLWITNNLIESIEDDVLDEISFEKINIMCDKLKLIHWNAFGGQAKK